MIFPLDVLFYLAIIAGVIILQIYLSRKPNRWLGLILPILSFLISLMMILSLSTYQDREIQQQTIDMETGESIEIKSSDGPIKQESIAPTTVAYIFLVANLPTICFLIIYFVCREKFKKKVELEKMNIQDLE